MVINSRNKALILYASQLQNKIDAIKQPKENYSILSKTKVKNK